MKFYLFLLFVAEILQQGYCIEKVESAWTFQCIEQQCRRVLKQNVPVEQQLTLNSCKLTCGQHATLWPLPQYVTLGKELLPFNKENIIFNTSAPSLDIIYLVERAQQIFKGYFKKNVRPSTSKRKVYVLVQLGGRDTKLTRETDEGYILIIESFETNTTATISANSFYGARHGLETLSQLITEDESGNLLIVNSATIADKPAYFHRGISIDTARNFYPITMLKNIINGMSYEKLNILHWHISDTNSFPFVSKSQPNMTKYGAYSTEKVYQVEEIKDLVDYARIRGVKIIPELDAPSHTGHGWEWGKLEGKGKFVYCLEKEDWANWCLQPPCGQLNPTNDAMYRVLGDLYREFLGVFDNDIFHFGGDEISIKCWTDPVVAKEAVDWLATRNLALNKTGVLELWDYFNTRAYNELKKANEGKHIPVILWSNTMTKPEHIQKYLNNSVHIPQIWDDLSNTETVDNWKQVLKMGYKVIMSNSDTMYLDCGFGPWVGGPPGSLNNWCSPYKSWQLIYDNKPENFFNTSEGVLGQEVTIWSESIEESSVQAKIWPRASAMAERTWSNPPTGWSEAEHRMISHRQRLVDRGILADGTQPLWCFYNEGRCFADQPPAKEDNIL